MRREKESSQFDATMCASGEKPTALDPENVDVVREGVDLVRLAGVEAHDPGDRVNTRAVEGAGRLARLLEGGSE
jgi:hypothetical protein